MNQIIVLITLLFTYVALTVAADKPFKVGALASLPKNEKSNTEIGATDATLNSTKSLSSFRLMSAFFQSCKQCTYFDDDASQSQLICLCATPSGSWLKTWIDLNPIITNSYGVLKSRGSGFKGSCNSCQMTGEGSSARLQCTCLNGSGGSRVTSLDLNSFISNNNGNLQADSSASQQSASDASYSSCLVGGNTCWDSSAGPRYCHTACCSQNYHQDSVSGKDVCENGNFNSICWPNEHTCWNNAGTDSCQYHCCSKTYHHDDNVNADVCGPEPLCGVDGKVCYSSSTNAHWGHSWCCSKMYKHNDADNKDYCTGNDFSSTCWKDGVSCVNDDGANSCKYNCCASNDPDGKNYHHDDTVNADVCGPQSAMVPAPSVVRQCAVYTSTTTVNVAISTFTNYDSAVTKFKSVDNQLTSILACDSRIYDVKPAKWYLFNNANSWPQLPNDQNIEIFQRLLYCALGQITNPMNCGSIASVRKSWMTFMNLKQYIGIRLNDITLPASHDSGTYNGMNFANQCQSMSFAEQFDAGIRSFDVRPCWQDSTNEMHACHSQTSQDTLNKMMDDLNTKLNQNPEEIVVLKIEHGNGGGALQQLDKLYNLLVTTLGSKIINSTDTVAKDQSYGKRFPLISDMVAQNKRVMIFDMFNGIDYTFTTQSAPDFYRYSSLIFNNYDQSSGFKDYDMRGGYANAGDFQCHVMDFAYNQNLNTNNNNIYLGRAEFYTTIGSSTLCRGLAYNSNINILQGATTNWQFYGMVLGWLFGYTSAVTGQPFPIPYQVNNLVWDNFNPLVTDGAMAYTLMNLKTNSATMKSFEGNFKTSCALCIRNINIITCRCGTADVSIDVSSPSCITYNNNVYTPPKINYQNNQLQCTF